MSVCDAPYACEDCGVMSFVRDFECYCTTDTDDLRGGTMDREQMRERILSAFDHELDDPVAAVLGEIVQINEELKLSIMADYAEPKPEPVKIEDRHWGGDYDSNVFYHPENCGLELLATAEADEPYEFDYTCLWRDIDSGRYFIGSDSGCSCPTPFEDVLSVSDLAEVRTQADALDFTKYQLQRYTSDSVAAFIRAVKEHLPQW